MQNYTEEHMQHRLQEKLQDKTVLLMSQTGSRLYGTAHKDSDWDYVAVTLEGHKPQQSVVDALDVAVFPLDNFVNKVYRGIPNSVEVVYSPTKWVHPEWESFFSSLQPDLYQSQVSLLTEHHGKTPQHKRNMHTVRLSWYWLTIAAEGRYNPKLEGAALQLVRTAAFNYDMAEAVREFSKSVMPGEDKRQIALDLFL